MIPKGWVKTELKEMLKKIKGGGTPSRTEQAYWTDNGIPWITVKDLKKRIIEDSEEHITETGLNNSSANLIPAGTVILSTRMAVGKAVRCTRDAAINQDLKALFPRDDINSDFLHYLIDYHQKEMEMLSTGSTVKGIVLSDFERLAVLKPNLSEQKKIAKILSTWDEAIDKIGRLENHLAKMTQYFSSKVFASSGNKKIKISDALDFLRDGTHGTHANVDSGIPLLSAKDVGADGKITMNAPRLISESEYRKIHSKYEISAGDVLLTIVGTIGRAAIVPEKFDKFSVQRSVAILRPNKNYRSDYLYYFLRSDLTQKRLQKSANASAQAGIYLGELAKIEIEYLSLKEQERVIEKLKVLDRRLYLTGLIRANLKIQKKELMQQLLTGKKRVKV